MFPFALTNNVKILPLNDTMIKDRIVQSISQALPNKTGLKVNAIIVLEGDNEPKRTICINETLNTTNNIQITTAFPITSSINTSVSNNSINQNNTNTTNNTTNPGLIISQPPIFPASFDDLQALLNLASTNIGRVNNNNVDNNNTSGPITSTNNNIISLIKPPIFPQINTMPNKLEKSTSSSVIPHNMTNNSIAQLSEMTSESSSRKRKAEKPTRIPQDVPVESSNGLDLTMNVSNPGDSNVFNSQVWTNPFKIFKPASTTTPIKAKRNPLTSHKKSSKVFNCNQCKLQFNSLNALCKHTFSDHRAFRCTFCGANFTQRSNLQRHSLKHVGFKPFICNVCNKSYYRKDHLVRHIEVSHPGCDPKMNITVKLSSSECLEYLEKLQNDKLNEMDASNNINPISVPLNLTPALKPESYSPNQMPSDSVSPNQIATESSEVPTFSNDDETNDQDSSLKSEASLLIDTSVEPIKEETAIVIAEPIETKPTPDQYPLDKFNIPPPSEPINSM